MTPSATENSTIVIRDINGAAAMRAVEELQKETWRVPDLDVVPLTHMVAARAAGGTLIGAFDRETLVGFAYGFVDPCRFVRITRPSFSSGAYLKTHIPNRIYPPGTVPAYSNYGAALAGYIVERVSGHPFNQYVEENIFKPLGMTHSTFVQPLPPSLAPYMSSGFQLASDGPKPFEVVTPFPAGSLSSSAADMARFMMAHVQDGQLGDARILRSETARLMHSRQFALDPAANAMAYGFYE